MQFHGGQLVFDTISGMFYRMTPTATFLLQMLDSGAGLAALPDLLKKRYGLDHATAVRDVALFLNDVSALEPLKPLIPELSGPR